METSDIINYALYIIIVVVAIWIINYIYTQLNKKRTNNNEMEYSLGNLDVTITSIQPNDAKLSTNCATIMWQAAITRVVVVISRTIMWITLPLNRSSNKALVSWILRYILSMASLLSRHRPKAVTISKRPIIASRLMMS